MFSFNLFALISKLILVAVVSKNEFGHDLLPIIIYNLVISIPCSAVSTRLVAGIWWFFTLIMVSSYTANLAAFLTVESVTEPFKNVEDLVNNQNSITFGLKKRGSTEEYFRVWFIKCIHILKMLQNTSIIIITKMY